VGVCCFPCVLPLAEGLTYVVPSFASVQTDLAIEASVIRGSTDGLIESAVDHGRLCLLPLVASCGLPAARSWLVCRGLVRVCLSRSLVRVSVGRLRPGSVGPCMARAQTRGSSHRWLIY